MHSMPRKTLSDRTLKALKPASPGKRKLVHDAIVPGLAVRVTDKGRRTYVLIKRYPGHVHPAPRALGEVGAISLEQVREKARHWLELLRKGIDPATEEERQRQAELRKQANGFAAVAEAYIAHIHRQKQRKATVVERELRQEFVGRWKDRRITDITQHDVVAVIRAAVDRDAPYQAHNLFGHIRTLFGWAIGCGIYGLEHSPCDRLKPKNLIGAREPRQRVLDDAELRAFWRATDRMGYPFGSMFRTLVLTGQRKSEVSDARWREFDLDVGVWTVPPERFKSNATHLVPLAGDVVALLRGLPRFKRGEYLFSTTFGAKPVDGFSRAKARLDRLMLEELRALHGDAAELPPFVVHDLRRSVRTRLSSLRVPDTVAEMIIGHGRKGIQRVYDQHKFIEEMREALAAWAARLRDIVEPQPENVVRLEARA
jgi:integrase